MSAWDEVTLGRDGPTDGDGVATADGSELERAAEAEDAAAGEPPVAFDGEFEALLPQPARTRRTAALMATGTNTRLAMLLGIQFIEMLRSLV